MSVSVSISLRSVVFLISALIFAVLRQIYLIISLNTCLVKCLISEYKARCRVIVFSLSSVFSDYVIHVFMLCRSGQYNGCFGACFALTSITPRKCKMVLLFKEISKFVVPAPMTTVVSSYMYVRVCCRGKAGGVRVDFVTVSRFIQLLQFTRSAQRAQ